MCLAIIPDFIFGQGAFAVKEHFLVCPSEFFGHGFLEIFIFL